MCIKLNVNLKGDLSSRCVETSEQSDSPQSLKSEAKKVNKTQVQDVSTTSGAI